MTIPDYQSLMLPLLKLNNEVIIKAPTNIAKKNPIVISNENWNLQRKKGKCQVAHITVKSSVDFSAEYFACKCGNKNPLQPNSSKMEYVINGNNQLIYVICVERLNCLWVSENEYQWPENKGYVSKPIAKRRIGLNIISKDFLFIVLNLTAENNVFTPTFP